MRDDGVDRTVVLANAVESARTLGEVGAAPGAEPVRGEIERHDAKPRAAEGFDERRHEGGLARPAVHEQYGAAVVAVRLEHVSLQLTHGRMHSLPAGVAQVEARALGQHVVIVGSVLRQLRRAEDAESQVAREPMGRSASSRSALTLGQRTVLERLSRPFRLMRM